MTILRHGNLSTVSDTYTEGPLADENTGREASMGTRSGED